MTRKDLIPLLLSIFLITAIFLSAFVRYQRGLSVFSDDPADADMIFAGIYVLWIFARDADFQKRYEYRGKTDTGFRNLSDIRVRTGSHNFIGSMVSFGVESAECRSYCRHGTFYLRYLLSAVGNSYIGTVLLTQGSQVSRTSDHRFGGPYRFTRHPAYAGMIIANSGVSLYFFNWVTMCIFLLLLIPSILLRIFIEEKMLFNIGGYADFAKKRKRLCPFIW